MHVGVWEYWGSGLTFWSVFCQVFARGDLVVDFVAGFPRPSGNSGVGEEKVEDYVGGCEGWWKGAGRLDAEEEGLEGCEDGGHCVG